MAAFGRHAAAMPPDYRHPASCVVPLSFPFALDGAKVDFVPLAPPSLDGLEFLRGEGGLSARTILLVTTPLSPRAIGALRWPDVEALLAVAMGLLPPDLAEMMRLAVEPGESPPSVEQSDTMGQGDRPDTTDDLEVGAELGLDPAEFTRSV